MRRANRVPRKIGTSDEQEEAAASSQSEGLSAVRRPASVKSKTKSSIRPSFTPTAASEDEEDGSARIITKKTPLSRRILERNAERATSRTGSDDDGPSYTAESLAELKRSTLSQPPPKDDVEDLDIASKFGASATTALIDPDSLSSRIPTEAEIREKKERRRRLALESQAEPATEEADFISLDDSGTRNADYSSHSLILPAQDLSLRDEDRYEHTRLVPDDEDIAEGFDSFVEDPGRVTLSKKAAKDASKTRRKEMSAQIRAAQTGYNFSRDGLSSSNASEDDVDDDEAIANAAYEAAQTRSGAYGVTGAYQRKEKDKEEAFKRRLALQPKLRPIPDLKSALGRFGDQLRARKLELDVSRRRLEAVGKERAELEKEEERVRGLLEEKRQELGELRKKVDEEKAQKQNGSTDQELTPAQDWGLESLGSVVREKIDDQSNAQHTMADDATNRNPMRSFGGMGRIPSDEDEEGERDEWLQPKTRSFGGMAQIPAQDEYASDD